MTIVYLTYSFTINPFYLEMLCDFSYTYYMLNVNLLISVYIY